MSRRPYIDQHMIRDELHAIATYKDGYAQHCPQYEPVGMDGRNDWFRWHCRDCDRKYISLRAEKSMKYYRCKDCGALHFVYKGFFDRERSPTKPLRPSEVDGVLCQVRLAYAPSEYDTEGSWHYGLEAGLQAKAQKDTWEVVEPIQAVGKQEVEA